MLRFYNDYPSNILGAGFHNLLSFLLQQYDANSLLGFRSKEWLWFCFLWVGIASRRGIERSCYPETDETAAADPIETALAEIADEELDGEARAERRAEVVAILDAVDQLDNGASQPPTLEGVAEPGSTAIEGTAEPCSTCA